ncbi:MAG: cytochrome c biogenesis protein CcdA [Candidatus Moranbacteria bacterium]|nr:cytochrome c biogenesis protein CcdA [Candidatus Moranbacteria bacterium]
MILLIFFAFLSGVVTIFSPCIWPILPIVLSATVSGGERKPLGIIMGLMFSFTLFTLLITSLLKVVPVSADAFRLMAVVVISVMGLSLVVPAMGRYIESLISRLSERSGGRLQKRQGFKGGFVTGFALGIVWSPCAGPILATVATVAATQTLSIAVVLVTVAFVLGVGIPLFILALLGQHLLIRTRALSVYTQRIQQVFGVVMIVSAIALYLGFDIFLQTKFSEFCTQNGITIFDQFQTNPLVTDELEILRSGK